MPVTLSAFKGEPGIRTARLSFLVNDVKIFLAFVSPKLKCPLSAKLKCPLHREAGNGDNQHEHEGNQSFGSDAKVDAIAKSLTMASFILFCAEGW
jgi:hypothetical protein